MTPTVGLRTPGEAGPAPAGVLGCPDSPAGAPGRGVAVTLPTPSVLGTRDAWAPSSTIKSGATATQSLDLEPGRYAISLSYDATRPVTLDCPRQGTRAPGQPRLPRCHALLARGRDSPSTSRARSTFEATVERPPLAGRLLGADSVAHLNGLVATPAGPGSEPREVPLEDACGKLVDWFGREAALQQGSGDGPS